MLRLSRALLWLSEFVSDVHELCTTDATWPDIRARRWEPPLADLPRVNTSDRPFGLPD